MLNEILPFIPERARPLVVALVVLFLALQQVASVIVAMLPASAAQSPRWGAVVRALHRVANFRFRDEAGSLKLPGAGPLDPRAEAEALLQRLEQVVPGGPVVAPSKVPQPIAPRSGQSGRASVGELVAVSLGGIALAAALAGCPRLPERVGCAEGSRACVEGAPAVCDGDGRYHRAGDLACSAVGGVCVTSEGRAWCAPAVDSGNRDAADAAEGDDR